MKTTEVLEVVRSCVPASTAFVSTLGRTSEEVFRLFPEQTLFLDSMGDVSPLACGIALGLAPHHPVVALDSDGSHLMGISFLGTLASIVQRIPNLALIVLDNGIYESSGGLPSRAFNLDWTLLGQAFGLNIHVTESRTECETHLRKAFSECLYIVARVENSPDVPSVQKNMDGIESKYRFIRHLERVLNRKLLQPAVKS